MTDYAYFFCLSAVHFFKLPKNTQTNNNEIFF